MADPFQNVDAAGPEFIKLFADSMDARQLDAVLAYRYLDYDFGEDWVLRTITPTGQLLGVVFRF